MREHDTPADPHQDLQVTLNRFRLDALRNLIAVTALGVLIWYVWAGFESPVESLTILPILALLAMVYWLMGENRQAAATVYLLGSLIAIGLFSHTYRSSDSLSLYRLATLAAVVIFNPVIGLLTAVAGSMLSYLVLVDLAASAPLGGALHLGLDSVLIVFVTWSLSRNLLLSTQWASNSYEIARENLIAARERRAEVVLLNQQLERARERLEHANAALVRAWRAAEEAERRQKLMSAFISHELRTPLNLIVGFSEMLVLSPETYQEAHIPPKMRRDLNAIYQSSTQIAALIDDVLDLASSSNGYLALMREPANLGEIIDEAVEMLRDYIEAKGLALDVVKEGEPPPMAVDRLRIRQVMLNLLMNAARFTAQGMITVRVVAGQEHVRIEVQDTGSGIPAARLDTLFHEFAAAQPQSVDTGRSTGLGLPISRRLVEMHGGEMGVRSEMGHGSTFWWTLPLQGEGTSQAGLTRTPSQVTKSGAIEPALLVHDPDRSVVQRLRRWLSGYRLVPVADLAEAEKEAAEWRPLALIAGDVADWASEASLPVIRCPLPSAEEWARSLGVQGYLTKPVLAAELLQRVASQAKPGGRVLLVDDDTRFVNLVQRILQSADRSYVSTVAYNGEEALARMRADPPDLVLLDLALPVMSGQEVLEAKRADPYLAGIPVLVISAPPPEVETMPLGHFVELRDPQGLHLGQVIRLLRATLEAMSPDPTSTMGR